MTSLARTRHLGLALTIAAAGAVIQAACGGGGGDDRSSAASATGNPGAGGSGEGGVNAGGPSGLGGAFVGANGSGGAMQAFEVQPSDMQTLTVGIGQSAPTVTYTATLNGQPISAGWGVDRGDLGTVSPGPSDTAVFTPSGTTGGV